MKYSKTFRLLNSKRLAAAFTLALAATLMIGGANLLDLTRVKAAQEKSSKLPRTQEESSRELKPAGKQAGERRIIKPSSQAGRESSGERSALAACSASGMPISFGQTVNGVLTTDDCLSTRGTRYDIYTFNGIAGQQISIAQSSSDFDTFLSITEFIPIPGEVITPIGQDDDGGGGTNSRLPSGSGVATLPFTTTYYIIAEAFGPDDTLGNYTLTLSAASAPCAATPINIGGNANGNLSAGDCRLINDTFIDIYSFTGAAGQQISILETSGSFDAVTYLFDPDRTIIGSNNNGGGGTNARIPNGSGFVTLPSNGTYFVVASSVTRASGTSPIPTGSYTLTLSSGGTCPSTPITLGQTVNNALTVGDCLLPDETIVDFYTFNAVAGQQVAISMSSVSFDTFLFLRGPDTQLVTFNDDGGGGTNSRIPAGSGFFTLPASGTYTILANSFLPEEGEPAPSGNYTLSLTGPAAPVTNVQFSTASIPAVTEGTDRSIVVTVTRTGDTTGETFVSYATTDGTASERSDYIAALGRLRFVPGDNSETFEVVITDDAFAESPETFNLTLSNPVGATLGAQSTATATINSNDAVDGPSPVKDASFNSEFFVRQQYADFLNRVPDASGLNFWMGGIDSCGADLQCRKVKQVDTSAAFFLSIEFQETGFLAYRTHKAAFGNLTGKPVPVTLRSFLADTRQIGAGVVVGATGWEAVLEANKQVYFNEFVTRAEFIANYAVGLTAEQYVDALFTRAEVMPTAMERQAAIMAFGGGGTPGRAAALRSVAESQTLNNAEFRKAFVLQQYFGYLRRNPDDAPDANFDGFNFWLGKLNQFNGDFRAAEMVKAFIESIEYGNRFGL